MTQAPAPSLSVVIPAYNAAEHIEAALLSLANQSRTDFEAVIIDDGSDDATMAVVEAFIAHCGAGGPAFRLITKANGGVSAARNDGIAAARAALIGFLDADDRWSKDKVAQHLDVMAANPGVDLTYSGFRFVDGTGADLGEHFRPERGILAHPKLMRRNIIHTSTVIVRADVLADVGVFDTGMTTYEDFDLWLRISARAQGNIWGLPDVLTDYRRHGDQATGNWQKMHAGWQVVAARQAERHPQEWAKIKDDALAQQLEYCAALAYNAGEIKQARTLMWRAFKTAPRSILTQSHSLIMVGIALATHLPRPIQIVIGTVFHQVRQAKHRIDGWLRRATGSAKDRPHG